MSTMQDMEQLIEAYLFQHKQCPLPGIGALRIDAGKAISTPAENMILPPVPEIIFTSTEIPREKLVSVIAEGKQIMAPAAGLLLDEFCVRLKNMKVYEEVKLEHSGKFYIDHAGLLAFKPIRFPKEFLPPVSAVPVMHPNAHHTIRVGDKETTSDVMTAFYSDTEAARKERWWISAIILFILAIAVLFFYFYGNHPGSFGNASHMPAPAETQTYRTANDK